MAGFRPAWLRDVDGMVLRSYNEPWMSHMQAWMETVVEKVRPLLYPNGGPIILMQVENEDSGGEQDYVD